MVLRTPALAERLGRSGQLTGPAQPQARQEALDSQAEAIAQAEALGGRIIFRYGTLINAFSAALTGSAASALAERADVASVQPVSIIRLQNSTSVPFIGATDVWSAFGARGEGMTLALVDTGIDHTHADFG